MGFSLGLTDSPSHGGQFCHHALHKTCRCVLYRHMGAPTLRPKAVHIAPWNIQSPSDETAAGGAFSISAEILRCRLYSGPAGCRKCVGLLAGPKISVDLWQRGQVYMFSGKKLFYLDKAWSLSGYGSDGRWSGRSCCIRPEDSRCRKGRWCKNGGTPESKAREDCL